MNILYIGPYREDTENGHISRLYLEDISQKYSVTSRPLFVSNNIWTNNEEFIIQSERNQQENFDCCIQHAPLNMLTYSGYFKELLAIPILPISTKINNISDIDTLNKFHKTIVNTNKEESILIRSGLTSPIKRIDCPVNVDILKTVNKKFNFGLHNNNHKFYFIGDYKKDIEIIHKILLAFYISFRCDLSYSLIMLLNGDGQDRDHIEKTSTDIKNQLKILPYPKPLNELYIFEPMSYYDTLVLHNSCDVFLNLQYGGSKIHNEYAKFFGNPIIDYENTDTVDIPYGNNPSGYISGDDIESVTTNGIINRMRYHAQQKIIKNPNSELYSKQLSQII